MSTTAFLIFDLDGTISDPAVGIGRSLNFVVAAFVPKLHAWFDPNDRLDFIGDEAARYYKGDPIMLVKRHRGDAEDASRSVK